MSGVYFYRNFSTFFLRLLCLHILSQTNIFNGLTVPRYLKASLYVAQRLKSGTVKIEPTKIETNNRPNTLNFIFRQLVEQIQCFILKVFLFQTSIARWKITKPTDNTHRFKTHRSKTRFPKYLRAQSAVNAVQLLCFTVTLGLKILAQYRNRHFYLRNSMENFIVAQSTARSSVVITWFIIQMCNVLGSHTILINIRFENINANPNRDDSVKYRVNVVSAKFGNGYRDRRDTVVPKLYRFCENLRCVLIKQLKKKKKLGAIVK